MKYCNTCETFKDPSLFFKQASARDGLSTQCKICRSKVMKDYKKLRGGRMKQTESNKRYSDKNPERYKAWIKARQVYKTDCVVCGSTNVHKHHPDPKKPYKVICLCPIHHKEVHLKKIAIKLPS